MLIGWIVLGSLVTARGDHTGDLSRYFMVDFGIECTQCNKKICAGKQTRSRYRKDSMATVSFLACNQRGGDKSGGTRGILARDHCRRHPMMPLFFGLCWDKETRQDENN